ncbi:hypothetical protein [Streptomyces sp. NPDC052042]|uniref:hypothetical protein n=1 Tax=Streptomyces sp. NPDC052042 TaxID=3365683 RepID=UPI0037D414C0
MTTSDGWRRRRVPGARGRADAPRTPIDYAKVGRASVWRRARGMTPDQAVKALGEAELHARLDRRDEAAADDGGRRAAELAEWQRVVQLLTATGGPYNPDADVVVQEELAEDRRREEAEQQHRQEQQQLAARTDELAAHMRAGRLDRTVETRPGDEAARDVLVHRGDYHPVVDGWLAQALADRSGHYADPAARTAAADSLPEAVRAHAVLLTVLARSGAPAADGELEFAGRLAQADPEATDALAAWLERSLAPAELVEAGDR